MAENGRGDARAVGVESLGGGKGPAGRSGVMGYKYACMGFWC